ncbi:MAG: TRAP transporter small permease [Calditrichales bacterium]|nr:MAG: TRAP transporter small permease [Calditrichales bacterium]
MEKLTRTITKILEILLIFLMSAIVVDVTWQVFTRFILQDPSSFTEELAGFLLIWIGLLGGSYAVYTKAHLGIDIFARKLSVSSRRYLDIVIYLIVAIFSFFILVVGGYRLVDITFTLKQISPSIGIPMGYVYLVLPLTGVLIIYYSIIVIVTALTSKEYDPSKDIKINVID